MRLFRRIFALHLLLALSFPAFAAAPQASQSPPQSSAHSLAQPSTELRSSAQSLGDDPLAAAARELARKVIASVDAAMRGKLAIAPNFVNLSSVSPFEFQKASGAFRDEIGQTAEAPGIAQGIEAASLSITLAENLRGFLWIAQVTQDQSQQTFFVTVARELLIQPRQPSPSVTLQKEFLLSQPEPILDAALLFASPGAAPSLLVLQPRRVALFAQENGSWKLQSEAPVEHASPRPRDIRGRLQEGANGEEAVLPGVLCTISAGSALSASCKPGNAGWLFATAFPSLSTATTNGNTFTVSPLGSQEFYSLAAIAPPVSSGASAPLVATTSNGRALLFEGSSTLVPSFDDWGSDVAALYSPAFTPWPLLVTRAGDWTVPDAIQAFDIIGRQAVPVSPSIDFGGPITALWSEGENTVLAVSRNLKTGMYEAYFIRAVYNQ